MTFSPLRLTTAAVLLSNVLWAADPPPREATPPAKSTASPARGRGTPQRGPLPDPALLDGSAELPEKRPDFGMLGEFELPGSEQRTERVGGSSNEPGKADGEAKQDGQQQSASAGGSGRQAPSAGSAAPKNDPNAKAEGIQVSELKTDPDAGQGGPPASEKPPAVKIGDPAMQIQPISGGQTEVVGQQQVGQSQQFEKATPQGKQQGDNRNKGVEKGRTMPAGM